MELTHHLEAGLREVVALFKFALEFISVLCVLLGTIATLQLFTKGLRSHLPIPFSQLRLRFGTWLAMALEFQLGADVLATTVAPTIDVLINLAAIAVIRTFLNYFLHKELENEKHETERQQLLTSATHNEIIDKDR
ncbi:hypothetical protein C7H19_12170 [Aphanothece hegewaldii CCALA 016]|uniref:DUF1622 domain-containing protein n=1 Tax=Aphanothece hegewaldii CCALA 016 TaxID=2107694 RepID=A0A2T1LXU0_9CHRO|nr:DUF1622 domain-containing protein [Aphanothece hegewaldii]PSF37181.1 hypothetical protein C7H19_12170 [Aphanothece hegewaldii CCALA 016]